MKRRLIRRIFRFGTRITEGMSAGVLVVEERTFGSGAITGQARGGAEPEKKKLAVPGSAMSKVSQGPNLLIKLGGKTVRPRNGTPMRVELKAEDRRRLQARISVVTDRLNPKGR